MDQDFYREQCIILRDKYDSQWNKGMDKDMARLKKGEPLDYIIGWKPFLGAKIDLSLRPLIPRPETEFWVQQFIDTMKTYHLRDEIHVLDIFSGSGCVGIGVLENLPLASVDFVDADPTAIKQIKKSIARNKIHASRYRIIQSDIFKKLTAKNGPYNAILANPPYIPFGNKKKLDDSVKKYEPHVALFGGMDGLKFIKPLIADAKQFLKPNAQLWIEFDAPQKSAVEKLAKEAKFKICETKKDQYGKYRFAVLGN